MDNDREGREPNRPYREDPERGFREQLREKIEKITKARRAHEEKRDKGLCLVKPESTKPGVSENRDVVGGHSKPSGSLTSSASSASSSAESTGSSTADLFSNSFGTERARTMSALFREKYGANATDRVYGLTTESLDYLKAHPDLVIPGPNPQRIPHDEFLNVLTGFENMYLAHEICVNEDFRLERYTPPEDSMEARVQIQMRRAFWDIFEENLVKDPPNYNQALAVFEELKEGLLSLLLPHNHQMRQRIQNTLDLDLIRRQVEQDCFDSEEFRTFSRFVIDTLSQLCCPLRDEEIEAIRNMEGVSNIFRGIMEIMDGMKLDMANFYIQQFRPSIVRHCVQYERIKFADFMELEYFLKEDALRVTKNWLLRHKIGNRDLTTIIAKSFGELLSYNIDFEWPETLTLDLTRFAEISHQVKRLSIIGACLLTTGSLFQIIFGTVQPEFREIFKKQLKVLISDDDAKDPTLLREAMERVAEQAVFLVNEFVKKSLDRQVEDPEKAAIRTCVLDVINKEHKIRCLLLRRIIDYAEETCMAHHGHHVSMPAGLSSIQFEVAYIIGQFQRTVRHNRGVYGELYKEILDKWQHPPQYIDDQHPNGDPEFFGLMEKLRKQFIDLPTRAQADADKKLKEEAFAAAAVEKATKIAELERNRKRLIEDGVDPKIVYGGRKLGESSRATKLKAKLAKPPKAVRSKVEHVPKFTGLDEVPMDGPCIPDCRTGTPCSETFSEDTACSTAFSFNPEPDQESFVNKLPEEMTSDEMLGYNDYLQFKSFCCDAEMRRNKMIGKVVKSRRKKRPRCAPAKSGAKEEEAGEEETAEDEFEEEEYLEQSEDDDDEFSSPEAEMAGLELTTEGDDTAAEAIEIQQNGIPVSDEGERDSGQRVARVTFGGQSGTLTRSEPEDVEYNPTTGKPN